MSAEIAQFESSLAAEREKEADRQKKMMENLTKRKEELLAEAEKRKQVRLFHFLDIIEIIRITWRVTLTIPKLGDSSSTVSK